MMKRSLSLIIGFLFNLVCVWCRDIIIQQSWISINLLIRVNSYHQER